MIKLDQLSGKIDLFLFFINWGSTTGRRHIEQVCFKFNFMSCDGHKKVKAILEDLEYLVVILFGCRRLGGALVGSQEGKGQPLKLAEALPGVS